MIKIIVFSLVALTLLGFTLNSLKFEKQSLRSEAPAVDNSSLFVQWKEQYGKYYQDQIEETIRFIIFNSNLEKIQKHNMRADATYTMKENQFMDISEEEFEAIYLTYLGKPESNNQLHVSTLHEVPNDINWVQKGAVTPVKNQGNCGSCWAFSTTGCLEGVSALFAGGLQSFSEQQLVDCSWSYGNQGCNGGLMDDAFKYVIAHGIVTEAQYPYTGTDGKCKINSGSFKIKSYTDVPQGNCGALVDAVNQQPVSVAVDAETWQFYSSGIFSDCGVSLDHGVLLVGYVSNSYWLVKNSWGTSWGEQGYIQLAWGNTCGICTEPSYANY